MKKVLFPLISLLALTSCNISKTSNKSFKEYYLINYKPLLDNFSFEKNKFNGINDCTGAVVDYRNYSEIEEGINKKNDSYIEKNLQCGYSYLIPNYSDDSKYIGSNGEEEKFTSENRTIKLTNTGLFDEHIEKYIDEQHRWTYNKITIDKTGVKEPDCEIEKTDSLYLYIEHHYFDMDNNSIGTSISYESQIYNTKELYQPIEDSNYNCVERVEEHTVSKCFEILTQGTDVKKLLSYSDNNSVTEGNSRYNKLGRFEKGELTSTTESLSCDYLDTDNYSLTDNISLNKCNLIKTITYDSDFNVKTKSESNSEVNGFTIESLFPQEEIDKISISNLFNEFKKSRDTTPALEIVQNIINKLNIDLDNKDSHWDASKVSGGYHFEGNDLDGNRLTFITSGNCFCNFLYFDGHGTQVLTVDIE